LRSAWGLRYRPPSDPRHDIGRPPQGTGQGIEGYVSNPPNDWIAPWRTAPPTPPPTPPTASPRPSSPPPRGPPATTGARRPASRPPPAALDAADRIAEHEQRPAARTVRDKQRAMIDEQTTPALLGTLDALAQGQAPADATPALVAMIAAAIVRRVRTAVGDAL